MSDVFSMIINQAAEQIGLFIALDPLSSKALIDEIIEEKDTTSKLQKFISLALSQMKFHTNPSGYYRDYISSLIQNVTVKVPNAPQDIDNFGKWLPQHIEDTKRTIHTIEGKLDICKKALSETQKGIDSYAKASLSIKGLEEKIKTTQRENMRLIEQQRETEETTAFHKNQKLYAEQQIKNAEATILQLRNNNMKLMEVIADYKVKLEKARNQNKQLKETVIAFKNDGTYTSLERTELRNEIKLLEKACRKTRKLQKIGCGCFTEGIDWVRSHEELHRQYDTMEQENKTLKKRVKQLSIINKELRDNAEFYRTTNPQHCCCTCKCKCHRNDLMRIREKFDILDNDMDYMRDELDRQAERL